MKTACHEKYMQRCLELAVRGLGHVSPNPMVGAVLVFDGEIIGEGYHQQYGGPHAEVHCIESVKPEDQDKIKHSVLYVSLEPCCHYGKTPPCTSLIISSGIKEVVIACRDPFEKVNGGGISILQENGVHVTSGVFEKEAIQLNKRFFTACLKKRPYIILKWAQSANGKISAVGEQRKKISGADTDKLVHRWRSEEVGIMAGTNTVLEDNPALTTRLWPGKNPVRISIDKRNQFHQSLQILDGSAPTIIFGDQQEKKKNLRYVRLDNSKDFFSHFNSTLIAAGIQSLIVEGGAVTIQQFIDSGYWDEARIITNKRLIVSEGKDAPVLKSKILVNTMHIENDIIETFHNPLNQ
jgi:diaminohydroxyphosphoribosylaminopyrimidine deaminase/5-amino-6-(5-phosphoribosylamino)uracil reductase